MSGEAKWRRVGALRFRALVLDVDDGDGEKPYDGPRHDELNLEAWGAPYPKQRWFDGMWHEDQG